MTTFRVEHPDRSVLITDCRERADESARRFGGVVTVEPELTGPPATVLDETLYDPMLERQERLDEQFDEWCDEYNSHYIFNDGTLPYRETRKNFKAKED